MPVPSIFSPPAAAGAALGLDRGLVQPSTDYVPGDIVTIAQGIGSAGYTRVVITSPVTSSAGRFISGTKYKRLSPRQMGVNVMDFGAVGNGSTDDTAAIQAAIDWAAAQALTTGQGTSVHFPGAYYVISSTLVLKKHVWLVGEGQRSSTLKLATNANCHVIKTDDTGGSSGNADYTGIINMVIDGNADNQNGAGPYHGIVYNTTPTTTKATGDTFFDMHHTVMNCTIYRCKGNGLDATGRSAIQLYNIHAQSCDGNGFKLTFDITVVGCESDNAGLTGFNINNGSVKLVGCKSYLSGRLAPTTDGAGYKIGNVGPCELVGCEAQNNKLQGYNLVSADRVHLAGCNADSNNTQNSSADSDKCAVSMVGSTNCIIDVVCNETPQGGSQIGHQTHALHIDATSNFNDVRMTHSAVSPATVGSELSASSAPDTAGNNNVQINGVRATKIVFGPSSGAISGSNADTNLYRGSANVLKTDDTFHAVLGVATKTKAGTPSDADWTVAPPVGTIVIDTTANKIWVRTAAATWKSVGVA